VGGGWCLFAGLVYAGGGVEDGVEGAVVDSGA